VQVAPRNAKYDQIAGRRTIITEGGVEVHTVEHILATVAAWACDNLIIELNCVEAAEAKDGSAAPVRGAAAWSRAGQAELAQEVLQGSRSRCR